MRTGIKTHHVSTLYVTGIISNNMAHVNVIGDLQYAS